jgi:hypothetical protein
MRHQGVGRDPRRWHRNESFRGADIKMNRLKTAIVTEQLALG